ncbi:Chitinase 2 [Sporothrix eucalyptigena]|uniref:chitinase n=1 Tax=Sporothrix eucalyptigena TaxID=1812306 RepID=A0ABP0D2C8_9PEZI
MLRLSLIAAAVAFDLCKSASAGFTKSSADNVAVYWGQNSYGQSGGPYAQQRLAYYCSGKAYPSCRLVLSAAHLNLDTSIDIIPLAFLTSIADPAAVNFANAEANCTTFSGTALLSCPQIEQDIETCQSTYGKTILLSIGGSAYTQAGFSSPTTAAAAADGVWAMFGPPQVSSSASRPFGNAVVDGFDLDFESAVPNAVSFASQLRSHMDNATSAGAKSFYLSAAPQCPYPDAADGEMLGGAVFFDFVMVQFYNNPPCGLSSYQNGSATQSSFTVWDNWARTVSKNPQVRVFLGMPGGETAAGSGYTAGSTLGPILSALRRFSSFGGVMIWDMSQAYANAGFLGQVVSYLAPPQPAAANSTTVPHSTTANTSYYISVSANAPLATEAIALSQWHEQRVAQLSA